MTKILKKLMCKICKDSSRSSRGMTKILKKLMCKICKDSSRSSRGMRRNTLY